MKEKEIEENFEEGSLPLSKKDSQEKIIKDENDTSIVLHEKPKDLTEQLIEKLVLQEKPVQEKQEEGLLSENLISSTILQQKQDLQQNQGEEGFKEVDLIEDKTIIPHDEVKLGGEIIDQKGGAEDSVDKIE
ncbi:hypothetical protein [Candidatus Trichorickettsia mobilis]|uniref:hypothetical protein n=1 Tax=Candidatus Trichorickettsia mobilis TaxID=1346319 RepID=UPI0029317E9F|nr:hypothetical protein [Candidatus Trichorickettsia mobilis]